MLRLGRYERDLCANAIRFCVRSVNASTGVVSNPDCPSATPTPATWSQVTVLTRCNNNKIQSLAALNLQSELSHRLQTLGAKHQLLAGVDAAKERFNNFGATSLAKPNARRRRRRGPSAAHGDAEPPL